MPFIAPEDMKASERLPDWQGRYWRCESTSVAHAEIASGAAIHEHHHPHEEVWTVIERQLEISSEGQTRVAGPGTVVVVPPAARRAMRALSEARASMANRPVGHEFP